MNTEPAFDASAHPPEPPTGGKLVLAGTPIGNMGDASPRLRQAITAAHIIAAEDTRRFAALAERLGISHHARVISLFDHNEAARAVEVMRAIDDGLTVVLLTDAGMPAVSDPGYRIVKACADAQLPISVVPGPSAVLAALAVSGLPSDRFTFEGFLPRKDGDRVRVLATLAAEERTMVFFESPHRIHKTMDALAQCFGPDRQMSLSRELTKTYEETLRGTIAEVADALTEQVRGELTLVIAGADPTTANPADHVGELARLIDGGMRPKQAAGEVAARYGLSKRELYEAYLHQEK